MLDHPDPLNSTAGGGGGGHLFVSASLEHICSHSNNFRSNELRD